MTNKVLKERINHEIENLLHKIAEEEGLRDYKIDKTIGALKGDGYMGYITAVCITGTADSNKKVLSLVVKSASRSDALRIETPIVDLYVREIYMYNTVIPEFHKFQLEKGMAPFSGSAKCLKACLIDKSEALILENLKDKGYNLHERRLPMDHDHVSLVMAEYGRFHALSLALKDQEPERFKKLLVNMDDVFMKFMERANLTKMFTDQCKKALNSLDPVANKAAFDKFQSFIDNELSLFLKDLPKFVDKYSVILHGDCWTNNMMFKYEDKNNPTKPTKMCLIDLQLSRLASPVLDLAYFFYACSSKEVIDNLERYLGIYHDSLSQYLKQLGSDPHKLYPYAMLWDHWKRYAKYGLIFSALLFHVMLSEQDEVTDIAEVSESGKDLSEAFDYNIANIEEYNARARCVVLHFVKHNFI